MPNPIHERATAQRAEVEKRRKRRDELKRRYEESEYDLAIEEARLAAFDEVIALSVEVGPGDGGADLVYVGEDGKGSVFQVKTRGGRQVGAITKEWRRRLKHFYDRDVFFSVADVVELLRDEGMKTSPAEVSRTLQTHLRHNYINAGPKDQFRVTEFAADKFGFAKPKKTEAPEDDSGASAISISGPTGLSGQHPTQVVRDGSIPSGSTFPQKNGSLGGPADLLANRTEAAM